MCSQVQSAWDDRHQKILTTHRPVGRRELEGGAAPTSHITVVQPGGTVGDVAMVVFGLSQFTPGERTLVFSARQARRRGRRRDGAG